MTLLDAADLDGDAVAYRLFGVTRDKTRWRAEEIIRGAPLFTDDTRAELAWRIASRGYYAEQVGLVAAAVLAAHTDDAPLRFGLALAVADEARHADAFHQYAKALGGEPEDCAELLEPLDDALTVLPHMGRALVHTMLEGFAADEFILLRELFAGDPLAEIYRHVRRDEIQHVAIGLGYLARASAAEPGREMWRVHGRRWHEVGMALTHLDAVCSALGVLVGREPQQLHAWFLRRHSARLKAAGVVLRPAEPGGR